ncbi:class I SAM-dependent methyltransferase [Halorubellus sp. JP-L1]|uniref:class I SAM-dependent methyltransferase n=1 Tax=Halorubellus sp. JP-L1 TaxID=2715753 RepID=UPI00140C9E00|nr:class I SAM-dependent methyltransferase [Halorubellus sp. JP-L1]NHN41287.1 class I SAM-dependent methyltransferase [Halorubellus sp. JP-L1]
MVPESAPHEESTTDSSVDDRSGAETARVLAGHPSQSIDDVRDTYREQAATIDRTSWLNRALTGRYRRRLFGDARGRVLDVACGIGTNARYLPEDCEYVGVDVSPEMLANAEERLAQSSRETTVHEMNAQDLTFDDDSFETVVSSLSTCTFPDPVAALSEMARVCTPNGRIRLLEHGRSSVGAVARFQDWRADAHFEKHSCRWNQKPLEVVSRAPLEVVDSSTRFLGMITAIRARPA